MDDTITPRQKAVRLRLATKLKLLRGKLGVSQENLADLAGIHRNHVGQIERGRVGVTLDTVAALAEALQVHEAVLLSEPSEVPTPLKTGRKEKGETSGTRAEAKAAFKA